MIDAKTEYAQSVKDAVAYLNDPSTPLLQGKTIRLHIVSTQDNESYNATQEGNVRDLILGRRCTQH